MPSDISIEPFRGDIEEALKLNQDLSCDFALLFLERCLQSSVTAKLALIAMEVTSISTTVS